MITVEQMSLFHFLMTFTERNPYVNLCAREASEKGILLGAEYDGKPAGYLCAGYDTQTLLITYAYTLEEFRNKGVLSALVRKLSKMTKDTCLRISIKSDNPYYTAFASVCKHNRFEQRDSVKTYICRCEDPAVAEKWHGFMEKQGNRLCATLKRQGFQAMSFQDAPQELLSQVYSSQETDYGNTLDPKPFFDVKAKNMLYDMSFVAKKNGKLSAYVLAVGAGTGNVIYEHISAHAGELGRGAVFLPFCRAVDIFFDKHMKTASYAMYDSNQHAGAFRKKVLSIFDTRCSEVCNFYRYPMIFKE